MGETTIITGRVGRDPEMKYTQQGKAVTNFSVAVSQGKDRPAKWFSISCWERLAEVAHKYVTKGMVVECVGSIKAKAYVNKKGDLQASLELTARNIEFHSASQNGAGESDYTSPANDFNPPPRNMDDIPF